MWGDVHLLPEDQAWCVAGDIDFEWVYVAGTEELIDRPDTWQPADRGCSPRRPPPPCVCER